MITPFDLLRMPITYDIVVSDFGRAATVEYLRLSADRERYLIAKILDEGGHPFFDEYRRLMFTVIGDIAFYKHTAITESANRVGYLTEDILIGLGGTTASDDFLNRLLLAVLQELLSAIARGHQRLRVVIPCNGLAVVADKISSILISAEKLLALTPLHKFTTQDIDRIIGATIIVNTVPAAVVSYITRSVQSNERTPFLVVGTRGVNAIYRELARDYPIDVVPLSSEEYRLIDDAIVAAIGHDHAKTAIFQHTIQENMIAPRRVRFERLVVLEACTDFRMGIGISSLVTFAEAMVADCYQTIS